MKLTLTCPYARYDGEMRIMCKKAEGPCAHQRWKPCKGWAVLTEGADKCPVKEAKADGDKAGPVKAGRVRGQK